MKPILWLGCTYGDSLGVVSDGAICEGKDEEQSREDDFREHVSLGGKNKR